MTESEWLSCTDPQAMLVFIAGKVGLRKRRLFVAAAARLLWDHLDDELRRVVEEGERYADGLVPEVDARALSSRLYSNVTEGVLRLDPSRPFGWRDDPRVSAFLLAIATLHGERVLMRLHSGASWGAGSKVVSGALPPLLRDVVGDPFRPVVADPSWRTPAAVELAQAIYDARSFDQLPRLATALEEAECSNQDVLEHCRGGGQHVRGCWVVDMVLGKS